MSSEAATIAAAIVKPLQDGWNTANGNAFAAPFAEDADFVAIRGDYHKGKNVIAKGHDGIFASIYKGSTLQYDVIAARHVSDDVILAHVKSTLNAPSGPLAGIQNSIASLVLVKEGAKWLITSFHNTLVLPPPAK